jgi:hypothetical protein
LRGIAERGALAPLFVLITARPEFRPPWGVRSHHGTISLAPLDRHQVRHMVGELAARHALPKEVVEGVTERTGGVPLFVEEVTRLLLERGEQGGIQAIPPTLQQSLTARLDRLGPAREVAQIGSVIGRRAVESGHIPNLTNAYTFKAWLEALCGDAQASLHTAAKLTELSQEYAVPSFLAIGLLQSSSARYWLGDREGALTEYRQTVAAIAEQGIKLQVPIHQGLLAEMEAESQGPDAALTRIDAALALANETGQHWSDADLHRIRGGILLKHVPANTAAAEEAFLSAIAIAKQQKARSFELRATMSMARLWRDQGKREEARDLLAPVYCWFTEGFDTRDLKEAKALLDELSA